MERIAIINHDTHELLVEDIDINLLQKKYNGEEEEYIKDTYADMNNFSWDYITSAVYVLESGDITEIDFDELF